MLRLLFHFWSIVIDLCFIKYCFKNSIGLSFSMSKHYFEMTVQFYFWSSVNECGTHLANNFVISTYAYKILQTHIQLRCLAPLMSLLNHIFRFDLIQTSLALGTIHVSTTTMKFCELFHSIENSPNNMFLIFSSFFLMVFQWKK